MAFIEYQKTAGSPLVVGKTDTGQWVGFESGQQFLSSGGQWANVKTVNSLPSYIGYSQYSAPVQPKVTNTGLQMPAGYAASSPGGLQMPATITPTPTQNSIYAPAAGYTGPSITDFLKMAGQPTDLNYRTKLAAEYGISGYTGSASQNTQLLSILRGLASNQVTPTGVPTTMPSPGSLPTPQSAIPAQNLSQTGVSDLSKILGANLPPNFISSDIAGLLSLFGASTDSQKEYESISQKLIGAMEGLGGQGEDLQKALKDQGVFKAYEQVKELNLRAAQLQGELGKFDAESRTELENLTGRFPGDQAIESGLILGQQRQYMQQRELTRLTKTAELSATIALSQAYQGNAQIGMELASKAVDIKYMPILNQINTLKTQLELAAGKMSREDANRAKTIGALLDIKLNEVNMEKDMQMKIQSLAVEAASNGAPLSVVNQMRNAKDLAEAASFAGTFLKGALESTAKAGEGAVANLGPQTGESFGLPTYDTLAANPGMNRPNRNNNPGNIKASAYSTKFAGVIGVESRPAQDGGNFLIFDSAESGKAAIGRLLREGRAYQGVTAEQAMRAYSGGGYGGSAVGLNPGTNFQSQIADDGRLSALVDAIAKREGFTGGTTFNKDTSDSDTDTKTFTSTQLNKGAANAGLQLSEFNSLTDDEKNYFVNSYSSFQTILDNIQTGEEDADAVKQEIQSSNLSDKVKQILVGKIESIAGPSGGEEEGGGLFSRIGDAYNAVKNWLGNIF